MRTFLPPCSLVCCTLALSAATTLFCPDAAAQAILSTSPYIQQFDNIALGLPAGWQADTGATAVFAGYNQGTPGAYFINTPGTTTGWSNNSGSFKNMASVTGFPVFAGTTSALQSAAPNRALGIRQVAATDGRIAFVFEIANTISLQSFHLQFRLQSPDSNASRTATWIVDYATGANPTLFTPVAATGILTTGGNTFASNAVTADFGSALDNQPGPVYIRIASLGATSGGGSRPASAIDDFVLTWLGIPPPTHIQLTGHTPQGAGIPLSTDALTLHYDHAIEAGSGQVLLYKSGLPTPVATFTVPSAGISITDSTATLSGLSLEHNTPYFVRVTEGAFRKAGDTLPSQAITDSTTWSFTTADTTTPAPLPLPQTTLDETFTACNLISGGSFKAYSLAGSQSWQCSADGRNDAFAVRINGGFTEGISEANTDWLIAAAPFDLSAMSYPQLSLWQRKRLTGTAVQSIRVSTDYVAGDSPATASWTVLPVQWQDAGAGSGSWVQLEDIDLNAYKHTPFYLAFTYQCSTDGAYELYYDDIKIEERRVQGIGGGHAQALTVKVAGAATGGRIPLCITVGRASTLQLELLNLYGRSIWQGQLRATAGSTATDISVAGLPAGMYLLRVSDNKEQVKLKIPLQQ